MNPQPSNTGDPVAIRGFLVQTLVALLSITLEPGEGAEKFDFV